MAQDPQQLEPQNVKKDKKKKKKKGESFKLSYECMASAEMV